MMKNSEPLQVLKRYFGYDEFRPMQAVIIDTIMAGRDVLVLMPTGGGKSVCFQIPAIVLPGTCIVVSPLISLMKDQVEGLKAAGVRVAYLNSTVSGQSVRKIENDLYEGKLDLLYVSPEKLLSADFAPLLKNTNINSFAIDEAHCISSWGHDFRPEYTQLGFMKREFPNIPIVALTATADKVTRKDIIRQLQLVEPEVFIASFDRPNIRLTVRPGQQRLEQIITFIRNRKHQSGIIYCLSRKNTEDLSAKLNAAGIIARPYHAGLTDSQRSLTQEDFINDKIPVVCATVAFGMGIDKSNVRWVIHYNLPKNMEGYYQEIGRGGRDGGRTDTLLFYSYQDVTVLEDLIRQGAAEQVAIQLNKLERMRQYAEAQTCRRRILLSYFGEHLSENCQNCDVCIDPPRLFDGTVLAQKALSAVVRVQERASAGIIADVLRGSGKREIFEKGYHTIKTYGAGRDLSNAAWMHYLQQLIHLGMVEPAPEEQHALKLTPNGSRVLYSQEKVAMVQFISIKDRKAAEQIQLRQLSKVEQVGKRKRVRDALFEQLRKLRSQLAQEHGVPPYIIFSDASLEEMAGTRPLTLEALSNVSGVGALKLEKYGEQFLKIILEYVGQEP
jgi:ATP-dependent DNA helicase RecQ